MDENPPLNVVRAMCVANMASDERVACLKTFAAEHHDHARACAWHRDSNGWRPIHFTSLHGDVDTTLVLLHLTCEDLCFLHALEKPSLPRSFKEKLAKTWFLMNAAFAGTKKDPHKWTRDTALFVTSVVRLLVALGQRVVDEYLHQELRDLAGDAYLPCAVKHELRQKVIPALVTDRASASTSASCVIDS